MIEALLGLIEIIGELFHAPKGAGAGDRARRAGIRLCAWGLIFGAAIPAIYLALEFKSRSRGSGGWMVLAGAALLVMPVLGLKLIQAADRMPRR